MSENTSDTNKQERIVPDIGLTYEQIQTIVARKVKAVIEPHDPDMIVVAILNAFLEKQVEL